MHISPHESGQQAAYTLTDTINSFAEAGLNPPLLARCFEVRVDTLKDWRDGRSNPRAEAMENLDNLKFVFDALLSQGLPATRAAAWLKSRDHEPPFYRPLESIMHEPDAIAALVKKRLPDPIKPESSNTNRRSFEAGLAPTSTSAERVSTLKGLGFTQSYFERGLNVRGNTIYNWSHGVKEPRPEAAEVIDDFRCVIKAHVEHGLEPRAAMQWIINRCVDGPSPLIPLERLRFEPVIIFRALENRLHLPDRQIPEEQ